MGGLLVAFLIGLSTFSAVTMDKVQHKEPTRTQIEVVHEYPQPKDR